MGIQLVIVIPSSSSSGSSWFSVGRSRVSSVSLVSSFLITEMHLNWMQFSLIGLVGSGLVTGEQLEMVVDQVFH